MSIQKNISSDPRDFTLRDEFRDWIILVRDEVSRIITGIPDDTNAEAKDLRWLIKDLEKTRKELLYLEGRIADEASADPTQVFDFNAVRDQIGGRLDRLRITYCPKNISE